MRPVATATTPTSVPGSSRRAARHTARQTARHTARGFTLIELTIVVALIALGVGLASLALRDSAHTRLRTEAQRLGALLDAARAESRASGLAIVWRPSAVDDDADFRFLRGWGAQALPLDMPTRWLDAQVRADLGGAAAVWLGPEPVIGAQRIVLRLGEQQVQLATDGLGPFTLADDAAPP